MAEQERVLQPWEDGYDATLENQQAIEETTSGPKPWEDGFVESEDRSGYAGGPPVDLSTSKPAGEVIPQDISSNLEDPSVQGTLDNSQEARDLLKNDPFAAMPFDNTNPNEGANQLKQNLTTQKEKEYSQSVGGMANASGRIADAGLPKDFVPSTNMYEGNDNPWRYYEYLRERADSTSVTGAPIINNRIVPMPGEYGSGDSGADRGPLATLGDNIIQGAGRSGIKELLKTGAASIDELNKSLGKQSEYTQAIEDNFADAPRPATVTDQMIQEGVRIGAGLYVGKKAGDKIFGDSSFFAKWASGMASMIGGAIAMDSETETVLVGKNAIFPLLSGVPMEKDGTYSREHIQKKLDHVADAVAVAMPVDYLGRAASIGTKFVTAIAKDLTWNMFSHEARKATVAKEVLAKVFPGQTREEMKTAIQAIDDYESKIFQFAEDSGIPNQKLERTTMSTINEGAMTRSKAALDSGDIALAEREAASARSAMEIQAGVEQKGVPQTLNKVDQPGKMVNEMQDAAIQGRGGVSQMDKSAANIVEQGQKRVGAINDPVVVARQKLDEAEQHFQTLVNDPVIGAQVNKLLGAAQIDSNAEKMVASKGVIKTITDAVKKVKQEVHDAFDAIPSDVPIDFSTFSPLAKEAAEKGGLPPEVMRILTDESADIDFKVINNQILPALGRRIGAIKNSNQPDYQALNALSELRQNIVEHQLKFIEMNDPQAAELAKAASKAYREKIAQFTQEGTPLEKVFDSYDEAFNGKYRLHADKPAFEGVTQQAVEGLNDKTLAHSKNVIKFIRQNASPEETKQVLDIYTADITSGISDMILDGKQLHEIASSTYVKDIRKVSNTIRENFPEEAAQLDNLINKVKDGNISIKELESQLKGDPIKGTKGLIEEASIKRATLYEGVLNRFLTQHMDEGIVPSSKAENGFQVFKQLFNEENSHQTIKELMSMADEAGDPMVRDGIQAAWLQTLKDKISGVNNSFNPQGADQALKDTTSLWKYGEEIFQDKDTLDMYRGVVESVNNEFAKRSNKSLAPLHEGKPRELAGRAMDTAVTITFGPLNRVGSKIRSVASSVLRKSDPSDDMLMILDKIMADPQYAKDLFSKVSNAMPNPNADATKLLLWKTAVWSGLYHSDDKEIFMKAYNEMLGENTKDAYKEYGDTKSRSKDYKVPEGVK